MDIVSQPPPDTTNADMQQYELSRTEAADLLGVGIRRLEQLIDDGTIAARKLGAHRAAEVRVSRESVEQELARRAEQAYAMGPLGRARAVHAELVVELADAESRAEKLRSKAVELVEQELAAAERERLREEIRGRNALHEALGEPVEELPDPLACVPSSAIERELSKLLGPTTGEKLIEVQPDRPHPKNPKIMLRGYTPEPGDRPGPKPRTVYRRTGRDAKQGVIKQLHYRVRLAALRVGQLELEELQHAVDPKIDALRPELQAVYAKAFSCSALYEAARTAKVPDVDCEPLPEPVGWRNRDALRLVGAIFSGAEAAALSKQRDK